MSRVIRGRKIYNKNNVQNNNNNKDKGFTLVEVLAVVVIISVVIGVGFAIYFNIIEKSKERARVIAVNNIVEASELYSKEYEEIKWLNKYEDSDSVDVFNVVEEYVCVTVNELVNSGYFKKDFYKNELYEKAEITGNTYVRITRDIDNKSNLDIDVLGANTDRNQCELSDGDVLVPDGDNRYTDTIVVNYEDKNDDINVNESYSAYIKKKGSDDESSEINSSSFNNNKTQITVGGLTKNTAYVISVCVDLPDMGKSCKAKDFWTVDFVDSSISVSDFDEWSIDKDVTIRFDDTNIYGEGRNYFKSEVKADVVDITSTKVVFCSDNEDNLKDCKGSVNSTVASIEFGKWYYTVNDEIKLEVKENLDENQKKKVYVKVLDQTGNKSNVVNNYVNKIDNIAPEAPTIYTMYEIWGSRSYGISGSYSKDFGVDGTWATTAGDPYIYFNDVSDISGINGAYVELEEALSVDLPIQIFYATSSGGYSEANSNRVTLYKGTKKIVIPFTKSDIWTKVRFDIGSKSGLSYKIKSLAVMANSNQWNRDNIILQVLTEENGSGVDNWQYTYASNATSIGSDSSKNWVVHKNSNSNPYVPSAYSAERNQSTYIRVCDKVGNCSNNSSTYIKIDKTAPSAPTTMEFVYGDWSRYTQGTWSNQGIYAANTNDSKGPSGSTDSGSGVAKYQISSDKSTWIDYSYVYTNSMYGMTTDGTHNRYFRAVDNAGNVGSALTRTAMIDKTGPVVKFGTNGNSTSATSQSSKVTVTDATNGTIATSKYVWSASNAASASGGTSFTSGDTISKNGVNGTYYLCIYATDGVGNATNVCSNAFKFAQKYTVKYDCDGGSGAPGNQTVTYGSMFTTASMSCTKSGYTQSKWVDPTGDNTWTGWSGTWTYDNGQYGITDNVLTLKAQWTAKTYTVSYDCNGGSGAPSSQTATYGSTFTTASNICTRTGYTFAGWYDPTDVSWTGWSGIWSYDNGQYGITSNALTLKAKWTLNSYALTVNPNGGSFGGGTSSKTITKDYGKQLFIPAPTRTGYKFTGWTTSSGLTLTSYGTPSHSDPQFVSSLNGMSVYNNSGNGTVTLSKTTDSSNPYGGGNVVKIVTNGTASPSAGGFHQGPQTSLANNTYYHVIVAKIPTGYTINYACNHLWGGGASWQTSTAGTGKYETYILKIVTGSSSAQNSWGYTPGKAGDFGHIYLSGTNNTSVTWYVAHADMYQATTSTGLTGGGLYTTPAANHTLTANWSANTYKITYNANGGSGTMSDSQYTYGGSSVTLPSNTYTRTGYSFTNWRIYRPADGKWYGCTDNSVGCTSSAGNTTIGWHSQSDIALYYTPAPGWGFGSTTSEGYDLTFYAQWTINKVYVRMHMNGGSWAGSTNTSLSYSGSYVTLNGSTTVYTYTYGQTGIDLANWDNSSYINISRTGYVAIDGAEWNLKSDGTGTSFPDSSATVSANSLCDASSGDCTATLYVNWILDTTIYYVTASSGLRCRTSPSTADSTNIKTAYVCGTALAGYKYNDSWIYYPEQGCYLSSKYLSTTKQSCSSGSSSSGYTGTCVCEIGSGRTATYSCDDKGLYSSSDCSDYCSERASGRGSMVSSTC